MKEETKQAILKEIVDFTERVLPKIDLERLRRAMPFHAVFFTDEGLRAFKNQRSIVTSLGQRLIPRIAKLIASDKYESVWIEHEISGEADVGMVRKIREIVSLLRTGEITPNAELEWNQILRAASGKTRHESVRADLYIEDFEEGPLFVEIKSPRPNLDICAETKEKILIFRAIMHRKKQYGARGYLGLWYNPYIERENYSHSFTRKIMDMEREVLIGEEFWDKIGGPGTYNELLEILTMAQKMARKV